MPILAQESGWRLEIEVYLHGSADDIAIQLGELDEAWISGLMPSANHACSIAPPKGFVLGVDLHADRAPTLAVVGDADSTDVTALRTHVATGPRTAFGDVRMDFRCGHEPRPDPQPSGTLAEQVTALRERARTFLVPLVATLAERADPKFPGVRGTGAKVRAEMAGGTLSGAAVFADANFWRASFEMVQGDSTVAAAPVFLDLAAGEIDRACFMASVILPLTRPEGSMQGHLVETLAACGEISKEVEAQLAPGIAKHDRGRYDDALAIYATVLQAHPNSARALHERNLSRSERDGAKNATFLAEQPQTLQHDPIHGLLVVYDGVGEVDRFMRRVKLAPGPAERTVPGFMIWLLDLGDLFVDQGDAGYGGLVYTLALAAQAGRPVEDLTADIVLAATRAGANVDPMFKDAPGLRAAAEARAKLRPGG